MVTRQEHNPRRVSFIILHTTAMRPTATLDDLQDVFRARGWSRPGYHIVVDRKGVPHRLYPDSEYTNGAVDRYPTHPEYVPNLNARSIHIAWMGGLAPDGRNGIDNRTPEQVVALKELVLAYLYAYPEARFTGHYTFANKACPCFDFVAWLNLIGVPRHRVYHRGLPSPVKSVTPPERF